MSGYHCRACAAPATISPVTGVVRSCKCDTAVICDMQATVYGEGRVAEASPTEQLLAAFHAIGLNVLKAMRARVQ